MDEQNLTHVAFPLPPVHIVPFLYLPSLTTLPQSPHSTAGTNSIQTQNMDLHVVFSDETHVIEVALADTTADMRRKVASAVGLPEGSFDMSFGGEVMGKGADVTQLSAGNTIEVSLTMKFEAVAALRALGEADLTSERLKEVRDPEVARLLLQAEVATVIPDEFLEGSSLTRLDLSAVSTVTRIGGNFLSGCSSVTALDLSSLTTVTHIGYNFLSRCKSLTAVDLSSLDSITHTGDGFLSRCWSLTALDLSSLNRLEWIGDDFLKECSSLTELNLTSLNSITHTGDGFLSGCWSLTALDLSSLNRLEWIGDDFLKECSSLTELDLSSLDSVMHIGKANFCEGTNLQTIRLSGCSAVALRAVKEANLKVVPESRPKRKRDESPDEDCRRLRLSQ